MAAFEAMKKGEYISLMREIEITVDNERMPAWSMSKMQPQWTDAWTVEVVNGSGEVIHMDSFNYNPPL